MMSELTLESPVQFVPGVGPDRAALLARLNIETVEDLLWYLPRDVIDYGHVREPHELVPDESQTVRGVVVDLDARQLRNRRTLTTALLDCGTGYVRGSWFNQPWMIRKFTMGQSVLFSGKPKFRQRRWEFSHPEIQWLDDEDVPDPAHLVVTRYRLTEGLKARELKRMIAAALANCESLIADPLPESAARHFELISLSDALRNVHQPESLEQFAAGRDRLLFDDLFEFQLGLALRRRAWRARCNAPVLERTAKIDARIRRLFDFAYTAGQTQAVRDIAGDLKSGYAMHRLLQADVGAGKTVVALDTMLVAVAHGWQAVVMAPTELLAMQHWNTVETALGHSRVKRALLTGSLSPRERENVIAGLADGRVQLAVGTQALIQQDVQFDRLGVVVIDEQHKFGVAQRSRFSDSQQGAPPHVLVMTATPIPRTLCLTQFGDLDLTLVKDRPEGRQPVVTSKITGTAARTKAWDFVKDKIRSGRQLYVVCPLVDAGIDARDDAATNGAAAQQVFEQLTSQELAGLRVGLVHGRMKRDQRERTMDQFRERELDVLVATTVIEVGVDVPNATLMIVLDAERFGLSQLHQLRGRIARGRYRGYCFLFTESDAAESLSRLAVLERASDGFEVAEQDFALRGPGDILGTRQHGALPLRFATHERAPQILERARDEAFSLVRSGRFDEPEFAALKRRVLDRFAQLMELPRSG